MKNKTAVQVIITVHEKQNSSERTKAYIYG